MKHDQVNYLAVGSFVLITLFGLFAALAMITGRTGSTDDYHTYYNNVSGLKFGTLVTYEGYIVGQVEDITPEQDQGETSYRVDISVQEGWKIPSDSIARVVSSGLLSSVNIDIDEGKEKTYLKSGEEIKGEGAIDIFMAIAKVAADIGSVTTDGIKPLIDSVTKSLTTISKDAEKNVPIILARLRDLAGKLNSSAERFDSFVSEANLERVVKLIADMDTALVKLKPLLNASGEIIKNSKGNLTNAIADLRNSLQTVSQHINAITFNLETTSRNMSEFSRQIRENPRLLLGSKPPKDETKEAK